MKKSYFVIAVLVISLAAVGASADCLTVESGSNGYPVSGVWHIYNIDRSCWSVSGNVSESTLWCPPASGWQFGENWSPPATITASFTVPSDNVYTYWEVDDNLQLSSPYSSWWDYIDIGVSVHHPNNTTTYYSSVIHWNGTMDPDNGCQSRRSSNFSAAAGDTITVTITSASPGGTATILSAVPLVVNYQTQ